MVTSGNGRASAWAKVAGDPLFSSKGRGSGPRLTRLSSETLGATALEALRSSILSGRFTGGERLVEAKIAEEMGISRGPLREAMALLEKDGLIVNVPRRGKYVVELNPRAIDEQYGLRKVLEIYAVERLLESASPAKDAALERALHQVGEAARAGDPMRMSLADLAFHDMMYQLTEDELLIRVWREGVAGKLRILLNTTTRTLLPAEVELANHQRILDAIKSRDLARAREEVGWHVDDAWQRVRASVASGPAAPAALPAATLGRARRQG